MDLILVCMLDLLSWGYNDMARTGYISVNGKVVFVTTKNVSPTYPIGVTLGILNVDNCTVVKIQTFNTYANATQTTALLSYISNVQNGSVLIAVTSDETRNKLASALPILQANGVNPTILNYRGKFAFVSQIGGNAGYAAETRNSSDGNVELFVRVKSNCILSQYYC